MKATPEELRKSIFDATIRIKKMILGSNLPAKRDQIWEQLKKLDDHAWEIVDEFSEESEI